MSKSQWACIALIVAACLAVTRSAGAAYFSLEEAIRRASTRAPAAVDMRGSVASAMALGEGAKVPILGNPSLEITGEHGRYTRDVNVAGSLYVPIEVSGQRGARIAEWRNFVEWRRSSENVTRADVIAATAAAYGSVLVASARLDQATRTAQEARTEVEAYTARLRVGDATVYDVSVVDAEAARHRQVEISARATLARATARLSELTGSVLTAEAAVDSLPRLSAESVDVDKWVAEAPVLRTLGVESRYWTRVRERAEAERTPPLVLIATGGRGDYGEARVGGGLGFAFPVFRRNQGDIARAAAESDRASRVAVAVRQALVERARGALRAYGELMGGIDELDRTGIPAAERAATATVDAQRAGKVEIFRVVIARRDVTAIRARRLDLVELAWSAYSDLAAIRGALP